MSSLGSPNPLLFGAAKDYEIDRSLRLAAESSACYHRTWSGDDANLQKQTYSFWIKRTIIGTAHFMFTAWNNSNTDRIGFTSDNQFFIELKNGGSTEAEFHSDRVFRDPSAWMHVVVAFDTTDGTTDNRMKAYINNELITDWDTKDTIGQNYSMEGFGRANKQHVIGAYASSNTDRASFFDGYMADFYFIDGQQLTPSSFGEENADTGQWVPIEYKGTYGSKGWYINFSDNSDTTELGKDSSGNSQHFTPDNISVAAGVGNDSVTDTPTNNYPTLNSVDGYSTLSYEPSNGNLDYNISDTSAIPYSTMAIPTSGKWYAEFTATDIETAAFGFKPIEDFGLFSEGYLYAYHGKIWKNNSETQTVAAISDGDIIGVAVDRSAQTVQFSKNGTNIGNTEALVAGQEYKYWIARWASSGGNPQGSVNFGQRAFSHQPTGFVGLCSSELPTPTIKNGTKHFNTVLYTGNGGSSQTITGLDFSPNFVWFKERSGTQNHMVFDTVRGVEESLWPNDTWVEEAYSGEGVSAFNSNGVTIGNSGNLNVNSDTYVMWAWKGGGAASSNSDGSITSSVSANSSAGFSIVGYEGTGADATVGHGLGVVPDLLIIKGRDTANDWAVLSKDNDDGDFLQLNGNAAESGAGSIFGSSFTRPTSSVFTVGNAGETGTDNKDYIAYCFASVEGFSKISAWTGNASTNGPFVYCGFRPAFLLQKRASDSGTWHIFDDKRNTYNPTNKTLYAENNGAEYTNTGSDPQIDFLSNGFKVRSSYSQFNGSNDTLIFMAFAKSPFKYANAH